MWDMIVGELFANQAPGTGLGQQTVDGPQRSNRCAGAHAGGFCLSPVTGGSNATGPRVCVGCLAGGAGRSN